MLIIGSQAMKHWGLLPEGVEPRDTDIICTFEEFQRESARIKEEEGIIRCVPLSDKKFHIRNQAGWNYEFEIAWPGSGGADLLDLFDIERSGTTYAPTHVLLALKLSHRYLKDSPHFLKTMRTIQQLRALGVTIGTELEEWLPKREAETYVYKHPKLDVSKGEFFNGDGVNYIYDHDSIHETVALLADDYGDTPRPAYTYYMKDGAQVMTSKEKFFALPEQIRLYGVYEESCVLALERSQIPHDFKPSPRYSFELALMKVCTSITSGWFRAWAYDHYDDVIALYNKLGEDDYVQRFKRNQHLLKPFSGSNY